MRWLAMGAATDAATRWEPVLAWVGVLREIELGDFRDVFPGDPPGARGGVGLAASGAVGAVANGIGRRRAAHRGRGDAGRG